MSHFEKKLIILFCCLEACLLLVLGWQWSHKEVVLNIDHVNTRKLIAYNPSPMSGSVLAETTTAGDNTSDITSPVGTRVSSPADITNNAPSGTAPTSPTLREGATPEEVCVADRMARGDGDYSSCFTDLINQTNNTLAASDPFAKCISEMQKNNPDKSINDIYKECQAQISEEENVSISPEHTAAVQSCVRRQASTGTAAKTSKEVYKKCNEEVKVRFANYTNLQQCIAGELAILPGGSVSAKNRQEANYNCASFAKEGESFGNEPSVEAPTYKDHAECFIGEVQRIQPTGVWRKQTVEQANQICDQLFPPTTNSSN